METMPIYEYRCAACGHELEALQKISDAPLKKCPDAEAQARAAHVGALVSLKGGGWYETDFKSDGEKKRNLVEAAERKESAAADSGKTDGACKADGTKSDGAKKEAPRRTAPRKPQARRTAPRMESQPRRRRASNPRRSRHRAVGRRARCTCAVIWWRDF